MTATKRMTMIVVVSQGGRPQSLRKQPNEQLVVCLSEFCGWPVVVHYKKSSSGEQNASHRKTCALCTPAE